MTLRGALPPVLLRAVCLVRAILSVFDENLKNCLVKISHAKEVPRILWELRDSETVLVVPSNRAERLKFSNIYRKL
jgi:hypothetical protein